jgi:hypothetical protein
MLIFQIADTIFSAITEEIGFSSLVFTAFSLATLSAYNE